MMKYCDDCSMTYDDEFRFTLCPHDMLAGGRYCRLHDLFDCRLCKAADMMAKAKSDMEYQRIVSLVRIAILSIAGGAGIGWLFYKLAEWGGR